MTAALLMNQVGVDKLSPAAIAAKAKAFKGLLLLGGPVVFCGKYPDLFPANKFQVYPTWVETPPELQKKLKARTR